MFSPGNLRATFDNPAYERLLNYYIGERYTLRYTGGMVPDVFQVGSRCTPRKAGWLDPTGPGPVPTSRTHPNLTPVCTLGALSSALPCRSL